MRVIIDLVVNHTSDRHPWFRAARSPELRVPRLLRVGGRAPAEPKAEVVFPDAEDTIWAWDEKAGQYYLHHFYSHQPDLNIANPKVREEMAKIVGFWLGSGSTASGWTPSRSSSRPAGSPATSTRSPRLPPGPPVVHVAAPRAT